jgi:hypothetical protein
MSFLALAAEASGSAPNPMLPYLVAGTAFVILLALGVVTWSYRDVANRHREKLGVNDNHDSHAGH